MPNHQKRILVVEDVAGIRARIREELEAGGYQVDEAQNGLEALVKAAPPHAPPDLITLDIEMPKMGGLETCRKLRSPRFARFFGHCVDQLLPVVFLTGSDSIEDRRKAFELGAAEFIGKPFEKGRVCAAVDRILQPGLTDRGIRALIVDDNPMVRKVTANFLEHEGLKVISAEDGEQAYDLLCTQAETIDIVITDLVMPRMDGKELCSRIRNELSLTGLPVLFLTAMSDLSELLELFKAGATDYLVKPFAKEEFLARIRVHLELRRLNKQLNTTEKRLQTAGSTSQQAVRIEGHHQLKPNRAIQSSLQGIADMDAQLLMTSLDPEQQHYAESIRAQAESLLEMLDATPLAARDQAITNDQGSDSTGLDSMANHQQEAWPESGAPEHRAEQDVATQPEKDVSPDSMTQEDTSESEYRSRVWDRASFLDRAMDDEDFARELIKDFLLDCPRQIQELENRLGQGDALGVQHLAHTIKGTAGNLSAEAFEQTSRQMEQDAKSEELEAVEARMPELKERFEALKEAMLEFVHKESG